MPSLIKSGPVLPQAQAAAPPLMGPATVEEIGFIALADGAPIPTGTPAKTVIVRYSTV